MKIIVSLLIAMLSLFAKDLVVFENEFTLFQPEKTYGKVIVGNSDLLSVAALDKGLKLFGKKAGNTSMLIMYNDGTMDNYQIYVNQNLGFIQKMINTLAPGVILSRNGNGSAVLRGHLDNPHQKKKVYELLTSAGIEINATMDLTSTKTVEKMVRTKLYLVSIDNDRAEELGGAVGLNYFAKDGKISINSQSSTYATFSGFLLNQTGGFASNGNALLANLTFLQSKGVAKILDDTVLLSTEDNNASFHVGGEVYIPVGLTYNTGGTPPTINLEEKEYGLRLTMKPSFLEKDGFMGITVKIEDSEFDSDPAHQVQLGENIFVPAFRSKNIDTDVVAQSGQVIALGGRLHTESIKQEEKVPLLGDIPLLGYLFKYNLDSTRSNDLLFFLVPEIIDSNEKLDETNYYRTFKETSNVLHNHINEGGSHPSKDSEPVLKREVVEVAPNRVVISEEKLDAKGENEVNTPIDPVIELSKDNNQEQTAIIKTIYAEVTSPFLYVRSTPKDGKPIKTWKAGHRFSYTETKSIDNVVWMKIADDCKNGECKPVDKEMWISKNHVKVIM